MTITPPEQQILLDTNVILESLRLVPALKSKGWTDEQPLETRYLAIMAAAELLSDAR